MLLLAAEAFTATDPLAGEIRYRSRLYSLLVRGDTYASHGKELATAMLGPESGWMRDQLGFAVSDAIALEQAVTSTIEAKLEVLLTALGGAMKDAQEEVRSKKAAPATRQALSKLGKRGLLDAYFLSTLAQGIVPAMTFSLEELLERSPEIDADATERLLTALSTEPQEDYMSPLQRSPLLDGPRMPPIGRDYSTGKRFLAPLPICCVKPGPILPRT